VSGPARLAARVACAALALECLAAAPPATVAVALGATAPARVQGRFTMRTVVTTAVNVRGEHRGERLTRTWRIRPSRCHRDICRRLHLQRTRGRGRRLGVTLYRRRDGSWVGRGSFFVALSCRGRIDRHGARAPYTIRLQVAATRTVGGIRFARRLQATYVGRARIDRTRCAIGPSYDAARYSGRLRGGLPSPPQPAFTATVAAADVVSFLDASRKGAGPGRRIIAWDWNFGDPASGPADASALQSPEHQFTAPGSYVVSLTAIDHAGLRATVSQTVVVPPPAPAGVAALRDLSTPTGNNAHAGAQRSAGPTVASTSASSPTSAPSGRRRGITTA
jgi:PKD domain